MANASAKLVTACPDGKLKYGSVPEKGAKLKAFAFPPTNGRPRPTAHFITSAESTGTSTARKGIERASRVRAAADVKSTATADPPARSRPMPPPMSKEQTRLYRSPSEYEPARGWAHLAPASCQFRSHRLRPSTPRPPLLRKRSA